MCTIAFKLANQMRISNKFNRQKNEFSFGGIKSNLESKKLANVTRKIFLDYITTHFLARKPAGKVLLILDDPTSYTTNLEFLETAEKHCIIVFSLPPPTSRAFFNL